MRGTYTFFRAFFFLLAIGVGMVVAHRLWARTGLELQQGVRVVVELDMREVTENQRQSLLEITQERFERRLRLIGIDQSQMRIINTNTAYRIVVEILDQADTSLILPLLTTPAFLDFRMDTQPISIEDGQALDLTNFQLTELSSTSLTRVDFHQNQQTQQPELWVFFDESASQKLADLTRNNLGRRLGVFIDGYPLVMPLIEQPLTDGVAVITGDFTERQARQLAAQLSGGVLPVPVRIVEQRFLGQELVQP